MGTIVRLCPVIECEANPESGSALFLLQVHYATSRVQICAFILLELGQRQIRL
jgi:hypothetical protein